jgi:hypothetical protein
MYTMGGYALLRRYSQSRDVVEEAVLAAILNTVLRRAAGEGGFTTITAIAGRDRVLAPSSLAIGDYTTLAWIDEPKNDLTLDERIDRANEVLHSDEVRGGWGPLEASLYLISVGRQSFSPRIVLTSCLSEPPLKMPAGITFGYGLSLTPGIDLDCCVNNVDDRLNFHWDYKTTVFRQHLIEDLCREYCDLLSSVLGMTITDREAVVN